MKKLPLYLLILTCCAILASCNKSPFKGFDKMENGAYMHFHNVGNQGDTPKIGDFVVIDYKESIGDSLIYSSDWDEEEVRFEILEPTFVGDMMAGLMNMRVDDSATVAFHIDSMCVKMLGMEAVPDYLTPGTPFYVDVKLKNIITAEEAAKIYEQQLQQMKQDDYDRLAMYYSDESNTITKDGLIIMSVNGKGRGAKDGDVLKINFNMISLDGDTLLNLYDREPVAVVCGDLDLGTGFAEAMKYVPEGGDAHFVVPSSLAFDSIGLENYIPPYCSFILNVKSSKIYSPDEYEQEEKRLREKEEAENQIRKAEEPEKIKKFIKEYDINVEPSETGVYYLEIAEGTGDFVEKGDLVSMQYRLYNLENKLIESSYGGEPMSFVFGNDEMVPGIEEALEKMRVGGKATIIVPSVMAFGNVAIDKELPAYSTVIFDLELVAVYKSR